jgi:hypothetical protein
MSPTREGHFSDKDRFGTVLAPQARGVRTQPRDLSLGKNVTIIALKGLQWPSRECNNSFFAGEIGGFPGINALG